MKLDLNTAEVPTTKKISLKQAILDWYDLTLDEQEAIIDSLQEQIRESDTDKNHIKNYILDLRGRNYDSFAIFSIILKNPNRFSYLDYNEAGIRYSELGNQITELNKGDLLNYIDEVEEQRQRVLL